MATYNFDTVIDRRNSDALKYNVLAERYGDANLLPLWVADMDFATPDFILDALKQRLEHPVLGYATTPADYFPCIIDWIKSHHNWSVKQEWLSFIPGIVKGIGFAINVFVKEDEKVIIQPPVYHPFRIVPESLNREVVYNPLIENADGTYSMDFDNLAQVADSKCRLLILSNPHNPAGITWSADTLKRLADFCSERNIIVISDEIHCDMVLWGKKHIPFATVSDAAANCSITFGAPSKTFNIAGVVSSYSIIPNDVIRTKYYNWLVANELNEPTTFSPIATIAAFRKGEEWRKQMLAYVEDNINYVIDYCKQNIPAVKPLKPDASFLVWLDCRGLNLSHDELVDLFVKKAKLALNDGAMFGEKGNGFMRLNVATPRSVLTTALDQLSSVIK
jgi:cystathionine beta-lyase